MKHLLAASLLLALAACGTPDTGGTDAGSQPDAGSSADAGQNPDAGSTPDAGSPDAGQSPTDAGTSACPSQGGSNPSNVDGGCAFNAECPAAQRCECINYDCLCRPGARGTGCPGADACTVGEDCASSVCAENSTGGYTCSGTCATDADCGPALPLCRDVSFVGRICIRST